MPLQPGTAAPAPVLDALRSRGVTGPSLIAIVKEGCAACEDALPLIDAALDSAFGEKAPVVVFAQEDAHVTNGMKHALAEHTAFVADTDPHPVSRALETEFTPSIWRVDAQGKLVDLVEGFDPDGLARLLGDLSVAIGMERFRLFEEGEPKPRYRPG